MGGCLHHVTLTAWATHEIAVYCEGEGVAEVFKVSLLGDGRVFTEEEWSRSGAAEREWMYSEEYGFRSVHSPQPIFGVRVL